MITSTIRVDDELDPGGAGTGRGFYLQDGGYPGFADWIMETTSLAEPVVAFAEGRRARCSSIACVTIARTTSAWR